MSPLATEVFRAAREHGGRYLLPQRYSPPPDKPESDRDRKYASCQELVNEGFASWLESWLSNAPGIELITPADDHW